MSSGNPAATHLVIIVGAAISLRQFKAADLNKWKQHQLEDHKECSCEQARFHPNP